MYRVMSVFIFICRYIHPIVDCDKNGNHDEPTEWRHCSCSITQERVAAENTLTTSIFFRTVLRAGTGDPATNCSFQALSITFALIINEITVQETLLVACPASYSLTLGKICQQNKQSKGSLHTALLLMFFSSIFPSFHMLWEDVYS